MAQSKYRTTPDHSQTGWPKGVPYIIGNEVCERFSYYGMRSILQVYLTHLYAQQALQNISPDDQATATVHLFFVGVFGFPMIGAIIADRLLGKYHTILWLSIFYCLGHACLAVFEDHLPGVLTGLGLIAIGAGGIKPCVSAHVGDQFGKGNWFRLERIFQIFYFSVNLGSFTSTLFIPYIRTASWIPEDQRIAWAFGIPGVLMAIATVAFWLGRKTFVHVPPSPGGKLGLLDSLASVCFFLAFGSLVFTIKWWDDYMGRLMITSGGFFVAGWVVFAIRRSMKEDDGFLTITLGFVFGKSRGQLVERYGEEPVVGTIAVAKVFSLFILVSMFWALFDQHSTTWVRQAQMMDLSYSFLGFKGEMLPSQLQALNPFMVMVLIPFTALFLYPAMGKIGLRAPLRRMSVGMFLGALSFFAVAVIQNRIEADAETGADKLHALWQVIPYLLITLGEVMVSITGLEFAYSQAPKRMKSTIMGFWLLTTALGNVIVAVFFSRMGGMELSDSFWIFGGLMTGAAVVFTIGSAFYRYRDVTQ